VNPRDAYAPLVRATTERANGDDAFDVQDVFGEMRLYRNGGEVHIDVFFPHYTVDVGGDTPALVLGVQTGYDFFGSTRLYAEVIAADPRNGSMMRSLSDRRARRHVKPKAGSGTTVDEVTDWWADEFDRLDTVSDTLFGVIHDAQAYSFDLSDLPKTPADAYEALDVPQYVAEQSESHLPEPVRETASAWDYYVALSRTITESYDVKDGGSAIRRLVRTGNQILFRPATAHNRILGQFKRDFRSQRTLEGNRVAERVDEMQTDVRAAMDEYDSLRDRMTAMLDEADASSEAANS
jgi:hypothetical protein